MGCGRESTHRLHFGGETLSTAALTQDGLPSTEMRAGFRPLDVVGYGESLVVSSNSPGRPQVSGLSREPRFLFLTDPRGGSQIAIGLKEGDEMISDGRAAMWAPWGHRHFFAMTTAGPATGTGVEAEVLLYQRTGGVERRLKLPIERAELTRQIFEESREAFSRMGRPSDWEIIGPLFDQRESVELLPAYTDLVGSSSGENIWVQVSHRPPQRIWLDISISDLTARTVLMPDHMEVLDMRGSRVLALSKDEFGREIVHVLDLGG